MTVLINGVADQIPKSLLTTIGDIIAASAVGTPARIAAPASGQVLTGQGAGVLPAWAAAAGGRGTVIGAYTTFETAARFGADVGGSGSASFAASGVALNASAVANSYARRDWDLGSGTFSIFEGSPLFSALISCTTLNANDNAASAYCGLGQPTVAGTGHTFTVRHIGFKLLKASGPVSVNATQGDGTTENASAALTTVADGQHLDLVLKVNSSTSVDYYWRKDASALSAATNLTTNLPSFGNTSGSIRISVSNNNTAVDFVLTFGAAGYER